MRHQSLFFRFFPPPKFLVMPHAGLDISDDGIRMIEYARSQNGFAISKYDSEDFPEGLVDGGDIRDDKKFDEILSGFTRRNRIRYAKVSLPEEKVYLFQTDIPSKNTREATGNIEFKLEENVPLSAADAVFYFDILPRAVTGGALRASVSVAPKSFVEKLVARLRSMDVMPVAFEVAPKSIAKAIVPSSSDETILIVHIMRHKMGVYIVSGGVVCFSSTIALSSGTVGVMEKANIDDLVREVNRVRDYWITRPDAHSDIGHIEFVGYKADAVERAVKPKMFGGGSKVSLGDAWTNAFSVDDYIPPISSEDSLQYTVAAGLALPL